ncbi:hypothetical protein CK203_000998 [Vitis vinifera]|uniref:Uncharacterized protein n=1 Tax=Vitis vinifera TaxID=29760 RepID=A0A438KLV0_VITVI|nr:hypothetical protein CK203_000998 [Vitis vinifera]
MGFCWQYSCRDGDCIANFISIFPDYARVVSQHKRRPFVLWCLAVPPNYASQGRHIRNGLDNVESYGLVDGEAVSTEKFADNAIYFTKEQFNAGLRFPLPSLFKEFLHVTRILPAYIHPNMVRVLMGCSILSMLFNLDLSLLEVLFIYSIKKGKNDIYSFVASLPSLQLVTNLPDSTKGAARGHVLVKGVWAGLTEHPDRQFASNQSLKALGMNKLLHVLPWL